MVDPPKSQLQSMLQAAVQSFQWSYSLFWQLCPQQRILVWSDGYYNGAIKTRKTVGSTEVTTEEATLHRSQQLRELYESLSGDTNHQARRPSAALSPEDLTETEWFYLMCVSFSFPPGADLPGKAYVKRQHIWLTRANEVDSKIFSRAILAKSARIQTVVCIPLLDGVVELGTTERVQEDVVLIQRVRTLFSNDGQNPNHPPRPVLSEHSTSNPPTYSEPRFPPPLEGTHVAEYQEEVGSDPDPDPNTHNNAVDVAAELMQLDGGGGGIRFGSPDDGSNNLNSGFDLLAVSPSEEDHRNGSMEMWPLRDPMSSSSLQPPPQYSGIIPTYDELEEVDTNYSQTVSTILGNQSAPWSTYSYSTASAFSKWRPFPGPNDRARASQRALKYILLTVPLLHAKASTVEELNASHVLAERRRREKLNERFADLRSLVPFVTKMDKASILSDAIEYLKQLEKRIQELESERGGGPAKGRDSLRKMKSMKSRMRAEVEVSIIESDALVEIECLHKEGVLLRFMQVLGELGVVVTTVQSSISDGVLAAELRAKVKHNVNGKKASIMEVKRSINLIILHHLV